MTALHRLWRGEIPLVKAFWDWAVIGGLVVNGLTSGIFLALIMAGHNIAALIVGYAFSVPYNIVVLVGVWRAAERYTGDPRWAQTARIVTVIGMVLLSVT